MTGIDSVVRYEISARVRYEVFACVSEHIMDELLEEMHLQHIAIFAHILEIGIRGRWYDPWVAYENPSAKATFIKETAKLLGV